jgi:hypothetical protein
MSSVKSLKLQLQGFKGLSTLKKAQLQELVNVNNNKLHALKQMAKNKHLRGYSTMKKNEICDLIINDSIQTFNKTNKTNKNINKLTQDHKKLLVDNEKVLDKQKQKQIENKTILERTVPVSKYEELKKQHQQLMKKYEETVKNQQIKHQVNKKILKSNVTPFRPYESNFRNTIVLYKFNSHRLDENLGVEEFLDKYMPNAKNLLIQALQKYKGIKFQLSLRCVMQNQALDTVQSDFLSRMTVLMNKTDADLHLFDCKEKIIESYENFRAKGSGWNLKLVKNLHIHINRYTPMRGSSYMMLPDFLKNTKSIINIKNTDNKCFLWSVLRGIYNKSKNTERYTDLIQYEKTINMSSIEYPVKVTSFEKFENQNHVGINVYCYTKNDNNDDEKPFIYPIYISKKNSFTAINLLLLQNDDQSHYCLIKNFNRLNSSITKHNGAVEFCMRCLSYFHDTHTKKDNGDKEVKTAKQKLHEHMELCSKNEFCKVEMPTEGSKLFFNKHHKQLRIPYSIHCDFECLTVKMNDKQTNNTTKYQHHVPSQFGLYIVSDDAKWQPEPMLYDGPDAHIELLKKLKELETTIFNKLKAVAPMNMTDQDKLNFRQSTHCHICNKPYTKKTTKLETMTTYLVNIEVEPIIFAILIINSGLLFLLFSTISKVMTHILSYKLLIKWKISKKYL